MLTPLEMLTLSESHAYIEEIEQLKKDLLDMAAISVKADKYEKEVIRLKASSMALRSSLKKCRAKCKELQEAKRPTKQSRTSKAKVLVQALLDGDKSLSYQRIASKFFLSIQTIRNISSDLNKAKG